MTSELTSIPNVGPAIAGKLGRLGIAHPDDLRGRDPDELFERLCVLDGRTHDLCLLDTFAAAVSYANGAPARPWWEFSRERKARIHAGTGPAAATRDAEQSDQSTQNSLPSGSAMTMK